MKLKRKLKAGFLTVIMCISMFSATAFAYVPDDINAEKIAAESAEEGTVKEKTTEEESTARETENSTEDIDKALEELGLENLKSENLELDDESMAALFGLIFSELNMENAQETDAEEQTLTPEGNLTLVDDIGSTTGEGKQFITVVTKSGNYFYIIIDRDAEGTSTVHFLNQVDEYDLMSLMDEEDLEQLESEGTAGVAGAGEDGSERDGTGEKNEEKKTVTEEKVSETEAVKSSGKASDSSFKLANVMPFILLAMAVAGGGGFVLYQKIKKKKQEQQKPDPDAEYDDGEYEEEESEEDYGAYDSAEDEILMDDEYPDEDNLEE